MGEGKRARRKWNQYAIEDDIKFRGPLSYRHFKIIGWALFVLKMLLPPLKLASSLSPDVQGMLAMPLAVLELITPLSVFFLLVASLSQLLVRKNYVRQMLTNGGAALAIIVVFELIYHRYIVGGVDAFIGDRFLSMALCDGVFSMLNPVGFMTFNVFLDLFLCTCVLFFLNYEPQKVFVGEKRKWFRCFALLPVIYEFVCLWFKLQANAGDFHMPISAFPFLTAKPPMMFFVFCIMVIRQLMLESRFCKDGRTHEEFEAYLETNRDSFQFAKFAAILCLIAGAVDFVIALSAVFGELGANVGYLETLTDEAKDIWFNNMVNKYINAGFGGSADLLIFAPIMLLFNYKKTYKSTTVELAIPVVAIVVLIVIYMEAILAGIGIAGRLVREQVVPEMIGMVESMGVTEEDVAALLSGEVSLDLDELFASAEEGGLGLEELLGLEEGEVPLEEAAPDASQEGAPDAAQEAPAELAPAA